MVGWWRRMPRSARIPVVFLVAFVPLTCAWLWWTYPARRLERRLHALHFPAAIRLTGEEIDDQGWMCLDTCSSGDRSYVMALPPADAASAVAAELRHDGFRVDAHPCGGSETCEWTDTDAESVTTIQWIVYVTGHGLSGHVDIGVRVDGQPGVRLWLSVD